MTKEEAQDLASHWIAAWNAHDLDAIMAHYEETVELTSPVAAQLLNTLDGKVIGKPALRAYFQRGLTAYPELRRIHGNLPFRKGHPRRRQLQRLTTNRVTLSEAPQRESQDRHNRTK